MWPSAFLKQKPTNKQAEQQQQQQREKNLTESNDRLRKNSNKTHNYVNIIMINSIAIVA